MSGVSSVSWVKPDTTISSWPVNKSLPVALQPEKIADNESSAVNVPALATTPETIAVPASPQATSSGPKSPDRASC